MDPIAKVAQYKDSTAHSGETAIDELTDSTAKPAVPAIPPPPVIGDLPIELACNDLDSPSGSIHDGYVRDLTCLVKRGPRVYQGQYSDVYKGTCGEELVIFYLLSTIFPLHFR